MSTDCHRRPKETERNLGGYPCKSGWLRCRVESKIRSCPWANSTRVRTPAIIPTGNWGFQNLTLFGVTHAPRDRVFHRRAGGRTPPHFVVDAAAVEEEGHRPRAFPLRRHHPLPRYGPRSLRCEATGLNLASGLTFQINGTPIGGSGT